MAEPRNIVLRVAPDDNGFDCLIRPAPPWQPLDRESLPTYRKARRAAECLKVVHPDWIIVDQVPAKWRVAA